MVEASNISDGYIRFVRRCGVASQREGWELPKYRQNITAVASHEPPLAREHMSYGSRLIVRAKAVNKGPTSIASYRYVSKKQTKQTKHQL